MYGKIRIKKGKSCVSKINETLDLGCRFYKGIDVYKNYFFIKKAVDVPFLSV
ncbi:hypothetical protein CHCC20335_0814 [Bacillus paralicheniformis]|nr:hypothetical protein CHCC20335_0814 [Bacillus paralicheniformis]